MLHSQFISVVSVIKNPNHVFENRLIELVAYLEQNFFDFEIILIDNDSEYDKKLNFKEFCENKNQLKNIQVFVLANQVDLDIATCVGIDAALGDLICVVDLLKDNFTLISRMMVIYENSTDIVLGVSNSKVKRSWYTNLLRKIFLYVYSILHGFSLDKEAPRFRLLSRRVVNFIFLYPKPENVYRRVPVMGGFKRDYVVDKESSKSLISKNLRNEIKDNLSLIFSLDKNLLRLANYICLLAAFLNVGYSIYVVLSIFIRENIADGWTSLSLQQSGMFFLISIVLLLLSEFLLNNSDSSNAPKYFISEEFKTSRTHMFHDKNIVK